MKSRVLIPKPVEVNPYILNRGECESWDLPLHMGSQVPSMPQMPTWQQFWKARLGTCVESWVEQKARPHSQRKSREHFSLL